MSRYNKSDRVQISVLAICPRTAMVQNNLILRQRIIHSPASSGVCASEQTNERSGAREQSEQCRANERVVRANGRPNGPIRTTRFMAVLNHGDVSFDIQDQPSPGNINLHTLIRACIKRTSGGEGPARATSSLVFDGGDVSFGAPVDFIGDFHVHRTQKRRAQT